ncbi:RNA polymerase sigma factor [Demequina aestuarii]|uniref:RNA polymerase sigma factor n=1 Tax=Demequina aestuarii TaxID=327095 RepID=UPI0007839D39|nr:sigma-70 family RNA polymerase sigma factor [Demequina aestuarii]
MRRADEPEAPLWRRARDGDGEALGQVFDRHHPRVYGLALRTLRDVHAAEDATATAFFELWRRRDTVREVDGSVLPWLLVTTAHTCRNVTRSARRYRALIAKLPRESGAPAADDVAAREAGELWDHLDPRIGDALRALPRDTLGLFVLTVLEGYSVADAAATVGTTPDAAKQRLSRARARLREDLRELHPSAREEAHHD